MDGDQLRFPIIQKMGSKSTMKTSDLRDTDIDQLSLETKRVFERCIVPESHPQVDDWERDVNILMCRVLGTIDYELEHMPVGSKDGGSNSPRALLQSYRSRVATPLNVQNLLIMADPNVRTKEVRCHAVWHLNNLCRSIRSIWRTKLPNGKKFTLELIVMCATILDPFTDKMHQHAKCESPESCYCYNMVWSLLVHALAINRESTKDTMKVLQKFNWRAVLELRKKPYVSESKPGQPRSVTFYEVSLFTELHRVALDAWKEQCIPVKESKHFLQELGKCNVFFVRNLKRILSGEVYTSEVNHNQDPQERMKELMANLTIGNDRPTKVEDTFPFMDMIKAYFSCFINPTASLNEAQVNQLDALIKDVKKEMILVQCTGTMSDYLFLAQAKGEAYAMKTLSRMECCIHLLGEWEKIKMQTEEESIVRSNQIFQGGNSEEEIQERKKSMKERASKLKDTMLEVPGADNSQYDMCANCFKQESDLGRKLLGCSACRQVK